MQEDAVVVKNAYKRYGKGQPAILDGLNMTVPRGCIYGLLGSSGCGKTTLLSCVVGVRKLDQGEIWVLGGKPGQKDSGIPGPRVGYMPQEISLVGEFSVIGALYYFGRINGLEDKVIDERYAFFSKLLHLPPKDQLVKHLSGGQQRRVSFAAALIHKPELLILDEPTVGLDPILREDIWKFLVKLTKEEGISVVITTHYIEEAQFANRIGLMRHGQLLAETRPAELLSRFNCQRLEDAFLILSQQQNERKDRGILDVDNRAIAMNDLEQVSSPTLPTSQPDNRDSIECTVNSERRVVDNENSEKKKTPNRRTFLEKIFKALLIKNFLQFLRHPGGVLLAFVFPTVQTTLFFYAVGGNPRDTVVAVVNDEAGHCDYGRYVGKVIYEPDDNICDYIDISCRFLHGFNKSGMIKHYFHTIEEATQEVRSGKASATMYFSQNFSQAFQNRRDSFFGSVSDDDIATSKIHMTLDMGDREIGLFLQKSLYDQFFDVHEEIVSNCNISRKFANAPVHFEDPVFGRKDQKYSDYMAPAFILSIIFFLASAVSSSIIVADRAEGVWDRSLVQGVTTSAILFSHILTQFLMIIIQATVMLVITFGFFQLSYRGNFGLIIALTLLTGTCGMCYGFLISVLSSSHTMANFAAIGSFYPLVLTSGAVWPLEGMPLFLRYISYTMPTSVPTTALRTLLDKGYPISELEVYSGFLVISVWILIFVTLCLLGLRKS